MKKAFTSTLHEDEATELRLSVKQNFKEKKTWIAPELVLGAKENLVESA